MISPSYLVFYPENKRVLKYRQMEFVSHMKNQHTQTNPTMMMMKRTSSKGSTYKTRNLI